MCIRAYANLKGQKATYRKTAMRNSDICMASHDYLSAVNGIRFGRSSDRYDPERSLCKPTPYSRPEA